MINSLSVRVSIGALAVTVSASVVSGQIHARPAVPPSPLAKTDPAQRYADAWRAWDGGKFDVALAGLADLLKAPGTDALLPKIAELTGEQYQTMLVSNEPATATWRPTWAPDGLHFAYETGGGRGNVTHTHIATMGETVRELANVVGTGLAFSHDSHRAAYLATGDSTPTVRVRDVASGRETSLNSGGATVTELEWGVDGTLYGVASRTGTAAQVVSWPGGTEAMTPLTRGDSAKSNLVVAASGKYLVYNVSAGGGGRGGRGAGGGGASLAFEVFDIGAKTSRQFPGRNVAVSKDGSALTYIAMYGLNGGGNLQVSVNALSLAPLGEPKVLYLTSNQLQAPAISPDASHFAFQEMAREDWEIMVMEADDSLPKRLTHDVQHDLSPMFVSSTKLIGLIGEARHRRSYMYDVNISERTRLFHNNSVRTIAPEYEWVLSPDGKKILIVAERDGDTVTPHRFLYCMDLSKPVTRAMLVSRVDSALKAERDLRSFATKSFAPIDTAVKAATSEIDVSRIYDYAQTLYSFDTKFWSQPGNKKAREYLLSLYKSFGYANARFMPFVPQGRGGQPNTIETANVLAVLPGTENPELVYVVGSHFDSVLPGPGADDDASGTTALLEAARVLSKRPQPATIVFASFTGEEGGLLGSREFVRQVKDSLRIVGALNNDMIGFANDQRLDNTIRYSNAGIKDVQHAAALKYSNLITYDAFYYKSTDAAAFYDQYGDIVGGIGSYPVLGNPHYHQSHDVLETINQQLVAEVSKTTVATLMMLASSPSRLIGLEAVRGSSGSVNVKWKPSPEKGIVRYMVRSRAPGKAWVNLTVTTPAARVIDAPAGTVVEVKAVNRKGLEGWDWARVVVK